MRAAVLLSILLAGCASRPTGYPPAKWDYPLPRGYHMHLYPLPPDQLHAKCFSMVAIACTYPLPNECSVYVRSDYRVSIQWLHTLRRHERAHCPHGDQPPWPADHPYSVILS